MPRKPLCYGFKIALRYEALKGYLLATNNILLPLGVLPEKSERLRFENAIFQVVTGDGEASADLPQRKLGEEIRFGQTIRLIHVNTDTLLCESKRHRATKEKANQKVVLAALSSEEARASKWRVLPRYKVRSEGETILNQDHVIMQSLSGDTFLHVAASCDIFTDMYYELNASQTPSGFTVHNYDTERTDAHTNVLRGGDCVQLFHREERAFIVGDHAGSCILEPDMSSTRGRIVDIAMLQNSNTMFVVEFDDVFAGGLVSFGHVRRYRLKSLSTGMYICAQLRKDSHPHVDEQFDMPDIDPSIKLVLTESATDPGTRICFHQAADETGEMAKSRSRVFVEFPHVKEGMWLTVGGAIMTRLQRKRSIMSVKDAESVRPKKELRCMTEASHKDGIELIKVPNREFQELNAILALIPPIQRLKTMLADGELPPAQLLPQVRENLVTSARMCAVSIEEDVMRLGGIPLPVFQNRLVDQKLPQLCMELVEEIFGPKSPVKIELISSLSIIAESDQPDSPSGVLKYSDFLTIVRLCFQLAYLTAVKNPRNGTILAELFKTLTKYVEHPFGAARAVIALFNDNPKLVDTPDDLSTAETFVTLALKHRRSTSQYLQILKELCVCRNVPMKTAQSFIGQAIFDELVNSRDDGLKREEMLFRTRMQRSRVLIHAPMEQRRSPLGARTEVEMRDVLLEDFCSNQVDLGDSLVKTSSRSSISGASDGGIAQGQSPSQYFLVQLQLLAALCQGRHAANIQLVQAVIPTECILPAIRNPKLPPLYRAAFLDLLYTCVLDAPPLQDIVEQNRTIVHVLEGTIPTQSPQNLPLEAARVQLIEETKSFLMGFLKENSQMDPNDSGKTQCVLSALTCINELVRTGLITIHESVQWIEIFSCLIDGRNDKELPFDERYNRKFGKYSRFRLDEHSETIMEVKVAAMRVVEMFVQLIMATKVHVLIDVFASEGSKQLPHFSCILDFHPTSTIDERSKLLMKEKEDLESKKKRGLLMSGFGAITDVMGAGISAMAKAGTFVLKATGLKEGDKDDPLAYLDPFIDSLLDNLNYEDPRVVISATNLLLSMLNVHKYLLSPLSGVQIISSLQAFQFYEEVKPTLAMIAQYTTTNLPRTEYESITDALVSLSTKLHDPNSLLIDFGKQAVLKNMGIHIALAQLVSIIAAEVKSSSPFVTALLQAAYKFLTLMVTGSQETAQDIFPFIEKFIPNLPLFVGVGQLVVKIFEGNLDLCNSVSEQLLLDIVYTIPRANYDPLIAHILHLLVHQNCFGSIGRNQQSILKHLIEAEESIPGIIRCRDIFTGHNGRKQRDKLLRDEEWLSEHSRVQYHLEIMTVLYHCAHRDASASFGSRRHELRQAMFGSPSAPDEVLEVLCNSHLPFFYKATYLRFFAEIYIEERLLRMTLLEHKKFKVFLGVLQDDLLALDAALQEVAENAAFGSPQKPPQDSNVLRSQMLSSEAFLHYVFDAVIPCCKSICVSLIQENFAQEEETQYLESASEILEKMRDLAELCATCLQMAVRNHPIQPEDALPPGYIAEEQKEVYETNAAAIHPEVPAQLRSPQEFFFPAFSPLVDVSTQFDVVRVPYLPVISMKKLRDLITVFIEFNLKETDPELEQLCEDVDKYHLPRDDPVAEADLSPDIILFKSWKSFCSRFAEQYDQATAENMYCEAARVVLRKGLRGHIAIRQMVRVCDSFLLEDDDRIKLFAFLQRCVLIKESELTDASLIIAETLPLNEPDEGRRIELQQTLISLEKTQAQRQSILASWIGAYALAPKVMQAVSFDNQELVLSATNLACELLHEGNRDMQESILAWAKDRSDEEIFIQIRIKLLRAREQLRERKRAIKREVPSKNKRLEQLPEDLLTRLSRRFNFRNAERLLRLVQLLCEGHFAAMQNYLRTQEDNQISINDLEPMLGLLELLVKGIDQQTIGLAIQCLATITETIQGPCLGNQEFVISQNIGETITKLARTFYGDCSKEDNWDLRMASFTLILSLFEGHMNVQLISTLISSVSLKEIRLLMDNTYWEWAELHGEGKTEEGGLTMITAGIGKTLDFGKDIVKGLFVGLEDEDEFKDTLNLACHVFIFFKASLDMQTLSCQKIEHDVFLDKHGMTIKEAFRSASSFRQLSRKVATIEIMRNGIVEKAYFRRLTISTKNLHERNKEMLIASVDRSGDQARLSDFFESCYKIINEMEYYNRMSKTPGLALIHKYSMHLDYSALILVFAINIFMLWTVYFLHTGKFDIKSGKLEEAYNGMGITYIALSCMLFLHFFFGPALIHLKEKWEEWQDQKNQQAIAESKQTFSIEPPKFEFEAEKNLPFPAHFAISIYFILTWYPFYQRGLFLVFGFFGFYYNPVWYTIQLLQVIEKSPQLQNVVRSVTQNGKNLLLTGALMSVFVYIFAVVAYYNFSSQYTYDGFGSGAVCDSLIRCFVVNLVFGLKNGGGIAEITAPPLFGPNGDTSAYLRLLFDFLFFAILNVLFLNIVFGTILDTFGELREARDFITEDQTTKCFICGLNQQLFDRMAPGGFEQHIKFDHHMWDYLFYMHYVQKKSPDEHNGLEGFVAECMEKHEPKFFPHAKAMILTGAEEREKKREEERVRAGLAEGEDKGSPAASTVALPATQLAEMKEQLDRLEKIVLSLVQK